MRKGKRLPGVLAAASFALALPLACAQPVGGSSAPATPAQSPDATFIQQAGRSGMAAVELSRLADSASPSPAVRRTARRIITDQLRSNHELAMIAARENIQLPKTLDASDERLLESLSARRGPDFDRTYLQAMRDDHDKLIVLLNSAEATVSTDELRAYIRKTLPLVEARLDMIDIR